MEPATNEVSINDYEVQDDDEPMDETDRLTQNMFSSGEPCLKFVDIPGGRIFC